MKNKWKKKIREFIYSGSVVQDEGRTRLKDVKKGGGNCKKKKIKIKKTCKGNIAKGNEKWKPYLSLEGNIERNLNWICMCIINILEFNIKGLIARKSY